MDVNACEPAGDDYCRAIESYLCRKNDGHLIRIVGPAFECVCGWAQKGVPLKVAYRGIDRYVERYYAKGARRRPVRVEFCEADVLDVFDEWRRAVGVMAVRETRDTAAFGESPVDEAPRSHGSLKAHLERARARLATVTAGPPLDAVTRTTMSLLEELLASPALRGDARRAALARLRDADTAVNEAAWAACDAAARAELLAEATEELAPFRTRMPADAYEQSRTACVGRLTRERFKLPVLTFE